jgi:hypothetical protein
MRTLIARILVLSCLALAAAGPAVAAAQVNPFDNLPPAQQDTSTVQTTTSTTTGQDDGLQRWQEVLIFLAGIALIAGIGFAIVGDARKNAPVTEDEIAGAHKSSAAGARKAHSKAKSRKKAKAARAARKHNR